MNENSKITFFQTRSGKKPQRAHATDAGIDFFVPTFNSTFIKDLIAKNPFLLEREGYAGLSLTDRVPSTLYIGTSNYSAGPTGICGTPGPTGTPGPVGYVIEKPIPENLNIVKFDNKLGLSYFELGPHQRILIPSGIFCKMQTHNRALIAANKSGVATRDGLIFGAQVVDSSYQGEVHISVINTSSVGVRIYEDMKIIQFIETPIYTSELEFAPSLAEMYDEETTRGAGGFGSTDKK